MISTTVSMVATSQDWPLPKKSYVLDTFGPPSSRIVSTLLKGAPTTMYSPIRHELPPTHLHPIITADPFYKWAIDFMECLPTSAQCHKYIIVSVYYFTKWNKSMPTFEYKSTTTVNFFFNHV